MRIEIYKLSPYKSRYHIIREDESIENIDLDTKTYFVHDISHFVVEKELGFENGFWGMLAKGFKFNELFGKENHLTEELRTIEKIVGPIQSTTVGYFDKGNFQMLTSHLNIEISEKQLNSCISKIKALTTQWKSIAIGDKLTLNW